MNKIIINLLFKYFKKDLHNKLRFELNSYIELKDGFYPIRCTYIDDKIATFHDDMQRRDKIEFFRDLESEK